MLRLIERPKLHSVPAVPVTASFGHVRQVPPNTPMVVFEHFCYSVPHTLMGQRVWVRGTDTHVIIVHVGEAGPVEVARRALTRPGVPAIIDAHFPPAAAGALERVVRFSNKAEEEFLALGEGAALWLKEAAAAGTNKIRHKMERAVTLAKVMGNDVVDQGLGAAAVHHRFTHEDLVSIITNTAEPSGAINNPRHIVTDQTQWLSQGTSGWANFGTTNKPNTGNTGNASNASNAGVDGITGNAADDFEGATE